MSFLLSLVVWILMAVLFSVGIFLLVFKASPWLFIITTVFYLIGFWRYGCST